MKSYSISNFLLSKKGQISLHFIKENLPLSTRRLFKKFFQQQLKFLQTLVLTPLYSLIAYFLSFCNAFINDIFFKMSVMIKRRKKEQGIFSVCLFLCMSYSKYSKPFCTKYHSTAFFIIVRTFNLPYFSFFIKV